MDFNLAVDAWPRVSRCSMGALPSRVSRRCPVACAWVDADLLWSRFFVVGGVVHIGKHVGTSVEITGDHPKGLPFL